MTKATKRLFLCCATAVALSLVFAVVTRMSFRGEAVMNSVSYITDKNMTLGIDDSKEMNGQYFSVDTLNIEELYKTADLVVKASPCAGRILFSRAVKTKLQIKEVYKSDKRFVNEDIYMYEPCAVGLGGGLSFDSSGGYNIMDEKEEYVLFLKHVVQPDTLKKNAPAIVKEYLPVSAMYGKYSLKENKTLCLKKSNVEVGTTFYKQVKDYDIFVYDEKELEQYAINKEEVYKRFMLK